MEITFTVQTWIEVSTREEAEALAQRWVREVGGQATVFSRTTRPWAKSIQRLAQYGERS